MAAAVFERTCCGHSLTGLASKPQQNPRSSKRLEQVPQAPLAGRAKGSALGLPEEHRRHHSLSGIPLRRQSRISKVQCSAAGAFSGGFAEGEDPYKILGINPLASSDEIMTARRKRVKDAEKRGDTGLQEKIEKAYDSIMYGQLNKRAAGLAFGNVEVSKDIKYADRQPITPRWWPKKAPVDTKNVLINAAVAALLILSTASAREPTADKLPLVLIAMILRLYFKLGEFYAAEDNDAEAKNKARNQLMLRVLGLSFGSFIVAGLLSSVAASVFRVPLAVAVNTVVVGTVFYVVSFLR